MCLRKRPFLYTGEMVKERSFRRVTWITIFYFCSLAIAIVAALLLRGVHPGQLGNLANFMGPLAENLARGRGYRVCGSGMGAAGNVLCFKANRMPLPPFLLAGLIRLFGDRYLPVEIAKIALVLLPVAAAAELVMSRLAERSSLYLQMMMSTLLFLSLALPTQLIDVVNMQVEEGYSFCLLTYAVAVLLFGIGERNISWCRSSSFAVSVLALYLTKSSMIAAAAFLVCAFWLQVRDVRKRIVVLLIVLCGPLGWGMYTWRATGHFSTGTSLDGINLHKGNYPEFLDRYPPAPGTGLDQYDQELSAGRYFANEWAFNAYHMRAAKAYIETHPARTAEAIMWKAEVFFLSLRKVGSDQYTGWLGYLTDASMLLFRLLLWSGCGIALWLLLHGKAGTRRAAVAYLGTVAGVAAPYLAGFALTRHASVLSIPSALFLCWWIQYRATAGVCNGSPASLCAAPGQALSTGQ
jgi:hypothetical protein